MKKLREILPINEVHGAIFVPPGHDVSFNRFRSLSPNAIIGAGRKSLTGIKKEIRRTPLLGTGISINSIARYKPNRIIQRFKGKLGIYNNELMTKARELSGRGNIMRTPLGVGTGASASGGINGVRRSNYKPHLRKPRPVGMEHKQTLIQKGGGKSFKPKKRGATIQSGSWNRKPSSRL